jgi:hypothetical protein
MKTLAVSQGRSKPSGFSREAAESLAIEGLTFIAAEPTRIERFLALTGLSPQNLREAAANAHFLAAVLEHLSAEEDLLLAFAANAGHEPAAIVKAREMLSPRPESE